MGEGIVMNVKDTLHQKEQLDLDAFEEGFFEPKFCEVAINTKYTFLWEIYRVPNTSEKILF